MASNQANTSISLNEQSSLSASGEQVPAALSMMVDSMTSMVERAKIDLENADQRARADLENIDQRARKDVHYWTKEQERIFKKLIKKPEKT